MCIKLKKKIQAIDGIDKSLGIIQGSLGQMLGCMADTCWKFRVWTMTLGTLGKTKGLGQMICPMSVPCGFVCALVQIVQIVQIGSICPGVIDRQCLEPMLVCPLL